MKKAWFALTCSILIAFSSCQDPGLLLPSLDAGDSKSLVATVEPGSILKSGDLIPLSVSRNADTNQNPDSMIVRLVDGAVALNPTLISEIKFNRAQLQAATLPGMAVPDLKAGIYKLIFLMYQGTNLLRQESVLFFVGQEKPVLTGIVVQPGTLMPGGDGILELLLDLPDGSDAWIRWNSGSSVIKAGLASTGGNRISIKAPAQEGVYTYRAEVFPQAPPAGGDYSFKSPYFVENRVVVANRTSASSTDLGPDVDFPHLLHLVGTLTDSGWAKTSDAQSPAFSFVGDRRFDRQHDSLGYVLGNGSAIQYPLALMPDFSRQFAAMAVHLRLVPIDLKPGIFYRSRNSQGTAGLELSVNAAAGVSVRIWGPGFDQQTVSGVPLDLGIATEIQVGLARTGSATQLLLTINNQVVGSISISAGDGAGSPGGNSLPGQTEIGTTTGPQFLLDEYGIYQPQTTMQDAYYLAMQYRYGKALSFASAFSTGQIPAGFQVQGDVRVENGYLLIPPGASISLPPFQDSKTPLNLEIDFAEGSLVQGGLVSLEASGMVSGIVNLNGTIGQGNRLEKIAGFNVHPLNFTIQAVKLGYELAWPTFKFTLQASPYAGLTIHIAQGLQGLAALKISHIAGTAQSPDDGHINP